MVIDAGATKALLADGDVNATLGGFGAGDDGGVGPGDDGGVGA